MSQRSALPLAALGLRLRQSMAVSDRVPLVGLVLLTLALTAGGLLAEEWVPFTVLLLPMFLGSLLLGPRSLPWFVVFTCVCVVVVLLSMPFVSDRTVSRVAVTFAIALLIMATSFRRSRLGVSGPRGESMFVDLRDRIARQGTVPELPPDWSAESVLRAAGGTSFAGDFVVAGRTREDFLDLVVVDVSGKGVQAGTRSLFLSGALNGIVSALPGASFLPTANDYLLRQAWEEGFATAIHLHLDLATGDFELRKAGHPPAVWLHGGSGRWSVLASEGPALGLLPEADFECRTGRMLPGDGLMMFTDGLVESSSRDMDDGIDRLAARGVGLLTEGFEGGAERVVQAMYEPGDDVALVVVHRRPA